MRALLPSIAAVALVSSIATNAVWAQKPVFSYLWGPNFCTSSYLDASGASKSLGYPDAALCVVPDEKPPSTSRMPTAGEYYLDPNFGSKVRVLVAANSVHGYSAPSAISANNKYVITLVNNGTTTIYELATGRKVSEPPTTWEGVMWDVSDDNSYFYLAGPTIQKYNITTRSSTLQMDYSKAPYNFTSIRTGSQSDTSKDGWIPFLAGAQKQVCVFDSAHGNTYCSSYDVPVIGRTLGGIDGGGAWVSKGVDSQSNKRYVIIGASPIAVFSVNTGTGKLDFEEIGPEILEVGGGNKDGKCDPGEECLGGDHVDTLEDANGIQYFVNVLYTSVPNDELNFNTFRLNAGNKMTTLVSNGGGRTRVLPLAFGTDPGGANFYDFHIGCSKRAPYCVLSTVYFATGVQVSATAPVRRTPHQSEIMVMKGNGDEMRRLVQHRSVPIAGEVAASYFSYPRACLSPDASYVLYDSNFGEANAQRVTVAETGYGKTKIADGGVVNAANAAGKLSPGAYATIYGTNLANCRRSTSAPLPKAVCNTSVTVNGVEAALAYVSPEQINFVVPQSTAPSKAARVVVIRGSDAIDTDQYTVADTGLLEASPGVFAVQNSDYTLNGPASGNGLTRPLRLNETAIVYATGLGPISGDVPDGTAAPDKPLATTVNKVDVLVNDVPQNVSFSGLVPGFAGLFQVNFVLDPATPIRAQNSLVLRVRGQSSPAVAVSLVAQ